MLLTQLAHIGVISLVWGKKSGGQNKIIINFKMVSKEELDELLVISVIYRLKQSNAYLQKQFIFKSNSCAVSERKIKSVKLQRAV